jgi:hypothetical protein
LLKSFTAVAVLMLLSFTASAKVLSDQSKKFQFEVPDGFVAGSGASSGLYASADGQITVTSTLLPKLPKGKKLLDIIRQYSATQERSGKIPQRGGGLKLGGTEAMALVTKDPKGNLEYSFISEGEKGVALVVIVFKAPVKANPDLFAQLFTRSFRWVR